jgi:hypothetical protein
MMDAADGSAYGNGRNESAGQDRDQGADDPIYVDLTQALRNFGVLDEGDPCQCCNMLTPRNGLLHCAFVKLKTRWAVAANRYLIDHPEVRTHHKKCTLLLPIPYARELMRTWVPWALQRLQEDVANSARHYDTLSPEQLAAIDALPECDYDDDD